MQRILIFIVCSNRSILSGSSIYIVSALCKSTRHVPSVTYGGDSGWFCTLTQQNTVSLHSWQRQHGPLQIATEKPSTMGQQRISRAFRDLTCIHKHRGKRGKTRCFLRGCLPLWADATASVAKRIEGAISSNACKSSAVRSPLSNSLPIQSHAYVKRMHHILCTPLPLRRPHSSYISTCTTLCLTPVQRMRVCGGLQASNSSNM